MDPVKILKRSWQILWNYRALWIFGVILALATGGSGGGNYLFRNGMNRQESQYRPPFEISPEMGFKEGFNEFMQWLNRDLPRFDIHLDNLQPLIWTGIVLLLGLIILLLALAIARYVAETALIRMVDEYEKSGTKMSIRQGFRLGWSRTSWRLFLINLLVNLPIYLILLLLLLVGVGIFFLVSQGNQVLTITGIVAGIGFLFLFVFLLVILQVVLHLLRHFFWRASAIEELGVVASLRRGYLIVRRNWKSVGIMWLIMIGLGIAWGIAQIIAFFLLIPVMIVSALLGVVLAALPALIVAGITSLFLTGPLPWIVGAIVALPLFILVTFSPLIFLSGLFNVFLSSVWTLTYRELSAIEPIEIEAKPVEEDQKASNKA